MKTRLLVCAGVLLALFVLTGCPTTDGPTGPLNSPFLSEPVTVTPPIVNVGQMVIFLVPFTDIPGDLNGGQAIITDTQNGLNYQSIVSNATGTSGTLTVSITLSPLVRAGSWIHAIIVYDTAGNQSNPVNATVTVR